MDQNTQANEGEGELIRYYHLRYLIYLFFSSFYDVYRIYPPKITFILSSTQYTTAMEVELLECASQRDSDRSVRHITSLHDLKNDHIGKRF